MNLKRSLPIALAGCVAAALLAGPPPAQAAENLTEALTQGKAAVSLRYRFEHVDQDPFVEDAEASTLRGRLNYRTADWNGFAAFGEFDYIGTIGWNDYNEGGGNTPDRAQYPVVADPTGPDLNQAWLQWSSAGGALLRGGRQRITYDNHRFVGNVGWRQNEQTYDSVYFQKKAASGLDFQLAYAWQVNRIFGDDVPAGENEGDFWLGNLAQEWAGIGRLTGYYYDFDNDDTPGFSTRTWGARFAGSRKFDTMTFGYTAEYAYQDGAHNNPVDYDADYYRVDLSLGFGKVTPYVGYELLEGDDTRAGASFRTPLATLHAFNGWADMFLTTPDAGLEDLFGGLKGNLGAWAWDLLYHDFNAESGGGGFGSELDASLSRPFAEHYSILFKAARFDGEDGSPYPDTTKFWVQLTADF
jgi:hypothetical protein